MKRLAIIDDFQNVALEMADWTPLADDVSMTVFNDHLGDESALVGRLRDFELDRIFFQAAVDNIRAWLDGEPFKTLA